MDNLIFWIVDIIIFAFGASFGSFLNVVVYRVPAKLSIFWPPSRCPRCSHKLAKKDNVPILGWLWLRGRCRYCQNPISPRYPLVETACGIMFLLLFWLFDVRWQTLGAWAFFSWLLALSLIDLDTMTLPNVLTKSGLLAGLGFQAILGYQVTGNLPDLVKYLISGGNLMSGGIIGAVLGIWLFDAITILGAVAFGQAAMGGGDAKLAAMIGAWLGWKYVLVAAFLACAVGAFVGGGGILLGLLSRRQPIPFGPFLALGGILALVWGEKILTAYINWFFPIT